MSDKPFEEDIKMMKEIKYLYNINSEYDGDLGFEPDDIEATVSKIINLLLNMDEILIILV